MKMLKYTAALVTILLTTAALAGDHGKFVQFGSMHEALAQKNSIARVTLADVIKEPGFYGIGALENLQGEITISDGKPLVTVVDDQKLAWPASGDLGARKATLLVGGYVREWSETKTAKPLSRAEFETMVREMAAKSGQDANKPFVFRVEGRLADVRMHVIHGACPMHARLNKIELTKELQPFEGSYKDVEASVVAVYAQDAVGKLTHPDTSVHAHIVLKNDKGQTITGHLEDFTVASGATVMVPKAANSKT